jgi:DNA-binding NarL/FixJ family response regulator
MPDAITMDIDMPVIDGVEAARMIAAYFNVSVVLLSASDWGERVKEVWPLARGACLNSRAWGELVPTLRAAVRQRPAAESEVVHRGTERRGQHLVQRVRAGRQPDLRHDRNPGSRARARVAAGEASVRT